MSAAIEIESDFCSLFGRLAGPAGRLLRGRQKVVGQEVVSVVVRDLAPARIRRAKAVKGTLPVLRLVDTPTSCQLFQLVRARADGTVSTAVDLGPAALSNRPTEEIRRVGDLLRLS